MYRCSGKISFPFWKMYEVLTLVTIWQLPSASVWDFPERLMRRTMNMPVLQWNLLSHVEVIRPLPRKGITSRILEEAASRLTKIRE